MTATPFHGSDLEKIEQLYGIPKEKITGFGSNVNPLGLSPRLKEYLAARLDVLSSYPLLLTAGLIILGILVQFLTTGGKH